MVVVECAAAHLCLPTASDSASAANNAATPPANHNGHHVPMVGEAGSAGENDGAGSVEVDLKEFSVTIYQSASNSTLRIDFHLYGIVAADDKKEFDRLFELNQNRFRERVMVVVRSAETADLIDPSLGVIRRSILEKAQHIFGKPLLQEVVISDYSSLEN